MALERLENNLRKLEKWKEEGYRFVCLGCNTVYKRKPERFYEDGHGGRYIEMCRCDSDLFDTIDGIIKLIKRQISQLKTN
jgi:ribosome-associated translation inhibitor RaiA